MDIELEALRDWYEELYKRLIASEFYEIDKKVKITNIIEQILENNFKKTIEDIFSKQVFFGYLDKKTLTIELKKAGYGIHELFARKLRKRKSEILDKTQSLDLRKNWDEFLKYIETSLFLSIIEQYCERRFRRKIYYNYNIGKTCFAEKEMV